MNAIAKTLIVAWLVFMALAVTMGMAQGTDDTPACTEDCWDGPAPEDLDDDGLWWVTPEMAQDWCDRNPVECAKSPITLPHTGEATVPLAITALCLIFVGGTMVCILKDCD